MHANGSPCPASFDDRAFFDPDAQLPLPLPEAQSYAREVMRRARVLSTTGIDVRQDIAYGPHPLHRYNVFSPQRTSGAPIVIFWHGGGWTNGYRDYVSFMAPHVVGLDCVLVAPSYGLAPENPLPAAYEDSLAMLAHVTRNAAGFGGDAERLFLGGHSAGAHLARLIALRVRDAHQAGIAEGAIRACLPISGIMDLHHPQPAPQTLEERVYTMVLRDSREDVAMSPVGWARGNTVPICMSFGEFDSARVQTSNLHLADPLALEPGPSSLIVEPGLDHFGTHLSLNDAGAGWYRQLQQHLQEGKR